MDKEMILVSIATSLIASVVFWMVFSAIPAIFKYFKVRPVLEKDIQDINMHLLFFIQIPFLQSLHGPTVFQKDIKNRKLDKKDYENALYGKCLGKERCVNEFEHRLLAVGEKLWTSANEIDKRLDRIQRYSQFLRIKELLLLKDIGEKIHTYEFVEHYDIVDGSIFMAVDPSISYMKSNFYELYTLYHVLNELCDSFYLVKRNGYEKYRIAEFKLENKRYLGCFLRWMNLDKKHRALLALKYYYLNGNPRKAKKSLNKYLQLENQKLISLRSSLGFLLSEEGYKNMLIKMRGEDEVKEVDDCLSSEELIKKRFELRNLENKRLIEEKLKKTPKICELDAEERSRINKLFDGYL